MIVPLLARLYTKLLNKQVSMVFPPSVSVIKRVKFLPIPVRTQFDGHGHADTDRCSLSYASEWFASINEHRNRNTGAVHNHGRTGVTWACLAFTPYVLPD